MAEITDEEALQVVQLQTMAVMCYLEDDHLSQRSYIRPKFARRKEQGDFYHLVREVKLADNHGGVVDVSCMIQYSTSSR